MTTLILLNGEKLTIKESPLQIAGEISSSDKWIRLTLVTSNNLKEKQARFMINAIAYWF